MNEDDRRAIVAIWHLEKAIVHLKGYADADFKTHPRLLKTWAMDDIAKALAELNEDK